MKQQFTFGCGCGDVWPYEAATSDAAMALAVADGWQFLGSRAAQCPNCEVAYRVARNNVNGER